MKLLKIEEQQIKMSGLYQFGLEYICFEMYLGICDLNLHFFFLIVPKSNNEP